MSKANLAKAKKAKNDEFYTQIGDIENELLHYKEQLMDKVIFCNCDDPEESNFWKYFKLNFEHLGLKKLVSTHFESEKPSYKLEFDGKVTKKTKLNENGDFRSPEAVSILKESDIVVTNPPFSLFREYVAQLVELDKKFLIIGSQNAITYKDTFTLIQNNKIWLGYHVGAFKFEVPNSYNTGNIEINKDGKKFAKLGNIAWFTNLDTEKRHEQLLLYKEFSDEYYPKYDNYNAINVDKVKDIPRDYFGAIGVPITFMEKYNPEQFELIGIDRYVKDNPNYGKRFKFNQKEKYARILIRRRDNN